MYKPKSFRSGLFLYLCITAPTSFALDAVNVAAQIVDSTLAKEYASGANGPDSFDCSGLTWYSFGHLGIEINTTAATQATMSSGTLLTAPDVSELQPGDLLFFETDYERPGVITHVGIYEGNNQMLNAVSEEFGLRRSDITTSYWSPKLVSALRLPSITGMPSSWFKVGESVQAVADGVEVRQLRQNNLLTTHRTMKKKGDKGTIKFGPVAQSIQGTPYWWWKVDFESGVDGWVVEEDLRKVGSASADFRGLGDLPGGSFGSNAEAVSADGKVVVGNGTSAAGIEAFRWTATGGMKGLGDLPGGDFYSVATTVSANGSVVAGIGTTSNGQKGFRWTASSGMVDLDIGHIFDISSDGAVMVGIGPTNEAFRWTTTGGAVGIGDLPGGYFISFAAAVSADGKVVVGYSGSTAGFEAFRWTATGGMKGLGDLPGGDFYSSAQDVSADGKVVVGYGTSSNGTEAFRWTATGGMVGLGHLPGQVSSEARAVSGNGSVVVGQSGTQAFIWDSANGMQSLQEVLSTQYSVNLAGWYLYAANGISSDGKTIVGHGYSPKGGSEAWIVTLP